MDQHFFFSGTPNSCPRVPSQSQSTTFGDNLAACCLSSACFASCCCSLAPASILASLARMTQRRRRAIWRGSRRRLLQIKFSIARKCHIFNQHLGKACCCFSQCCFVHEEQPQAYIALFSQIAHPSPVRRSFRVQYPCSALTFSSCVREMLLRNAWIKSETQQGAETTKIKKLPYEKRLNTIEGKDRL